MISLHYTSHTKAYNTIYTACNIVEAIYSFTHILKLTKLQKSPNINAKTVIYKHVNGNVQ